MSDMDNFIVSARKYRPATFDTVVGQQAITTTLKNAIRNHSLAQAYLFCGPRGVGKTTCARIMAKTINCLHPTENMEACNECESCRSFNNNASFNIYELDAASNNSVDDIRNLVEQVRIPPQIGQYKVYIIDEVHMLSKDAFNAFLKTLEEPPAYAKFILATTEKHKIIPTILSRCQIFDFKRITIEDIEKHLAFVASSEGVTADPDALNIIAQKADGALRDALSIFDQMVSFSGNNITYNSVIENLNVLDYDYYFRVVDDLLQGNTSDILLLVNDIINKGFEPQHFVTGMGNHLRSLLVSRDAATVQLLEVSEKLRQNYVEQARRCPLPFLVRALDINDKCDIDYRAASNKRLHLEVNLLKMMPAGNPTDRTPQGGVNIAPSQQPQAKPAQTGPTQAMPTSTGSTLTGQSQPKPSQTESSQTGPKIEPKVEPKPEPRPESRLEPRPEPKPQPKPEATAEQAPARPRPRGGSSTISITKSMEQSAKAEEEEPTWDSPFSQEQLEASWNEFVNKYKKISPNFAAGLGKYKPELKPGFEIHFNVDNMLFESDNEGMTALRSHLKNTLHNNQYKLCPELMERPAEIEAYTDKEKFEKLAAAHPELRKLQTELKLEGDL